MPSRSELVAYGRNTDDEIAAAIGADVIIFQTLPDLVASVRHLNPSIKEFDCSVFTGDYVTGGVGEAYLQHLEGLRADNVKGKVKPDTAQLESSAGTSPQALTPINSSDDTMGLHNTWKTT